MTTLASFSRTFKKVMCTLLANAVVFATLSTPMQQAQAQGGLAVSPDGPEYRNECSVPDCAFQYSVPVDHWVEVSRVEGQPADGGGGKADGREYFAGEQWMALGQHNAGALGASSAATGTSAWVQPAIQPHPWVVARFLPERGELRISVLKNQRFPDGSQKVMVADYTPQHGRWHVARGMFLDETEKGNPGIDPFSPKHAGAQADPTFYNMNAGAAQVAVGQAMMHHRAPYALFVEAALRIDQSQSKGGNMLRKKITTTTTGFAKPTIYLASPLSMSTQRNSGNPSAMGVICPRTTPCTHADQLAFAGFVLEHLEGGNISEIEEEIYRSVVTKKEWTGLARAMAFAAVAWAGGALMAGSASWGVAGGQIVSLGGVTSASMAAQAVVGSTIAAGAGVGYAAVSMLLHGGPVTSAQSKWLGAMGFAPEQASLGVSSGSECTSEHCVGVHAAASARHTQSGSPGTEQSGGNLQSTRRLIEGTCSVKLGREECEAGGLEPGGMPRRDSNPKTAYSAKDFTRKRQACMNAYPGGDQKTLYNCMASAYFTDGSDSVD
jgi:hypothetical protein